MPLNSSQIRLRTRTHTGLFLISLAFFPSQFTWAKDWPWSFVGQGHRRIFAVPEGTTLTLLPRLDIPLGMLDPITRTSDSVINLSWTLVFPLDKLGTMTMGMKHPHPAHWLSKFWSLLPSTSTHMRKGKAAKVIRPTFDDVSSSRSRGQMSPLNSPPHLGTHHHGGERAHLIPKLEKILDSIGFQGKSCLLRSICETHALLPTHSQSLGLFGEILTLIFSISRSKYAATHLREYLEAEESGRKGSSNCIQYHSNCNKSIFA